jgi:small-conductance mechanosensitive channel
LFGLLLLTKRPFRISDYIKIGDNEGKVVTIGSFYVFLKPISYHPKDSLIKVPNKFFWKKIFLIMAQ